jgi:OOP family OmpA-OmpF porin
MNTVHPPTLKLRRAKQSTVRGKIGMLLFVALILFLPAAVWAQAGLSTKNKKAIELYTQADNYRVRGQYTQAIRMLIEAIDRDKDFVEAYYRLGIVYMSLKDYPRAVQQFEKGLSLTSDVRKQKVIWFDLGEAYFVMGRYDEAETVLKNFLKAETMNAQRIAGRTSCCAMSLLQKKRARMIGDTGSAY